MKYYIFLNNGTVVWATLKTSFDEMMADKKNYRYMGTIDSAFGSVGPNIEPYKGKNQPS